MTNKAITALTAATALAGTEVLPIVQSGITVKVAADDLTVKNIRSNATSGVLQIAGPAAASTRVVTVPNANWTAARTDAAQSFTGDQTLSTGNLIQGTAAKGITTGGAFSLGLGTNGSTSQATLDTSGNFVTVGQTTSTSFSTVDVGAVSVPTATATTIYTFPVVAIGMYLVSVQSIQGDAANFSAFAVIAIDNTTARIVFNGSAPFATLTMSGLALQVAQGSGGTKTFYATITRVKSI